MITYLACIWIGVAIGMCLSAVLRPDHENA
jgi:hypothetical protein